MQLSHLCSLILIKTDFEMAPHHGDNVKSAETDCFDETAPTGNISPVGAAFG